MQTRLIFNRWFRLLRYAYRVFGGLFFAGVVFVVINSSVFTIFRVDGHSMDPTLSNGESLPVCLICARILTPHVGDIVIVQYEGASSVRFVKRVEGVPGTIVPYQGQPYTLKDNEFFVVGDNRDHSTDSRVYGPIDRSQIKAFVIGIFGSGPGPLSVDTL